MTFGAAQPAPMMVPPTPAPAQQLTPPNQKPKAQNMTPTVVGQALAPQPGQTYAPSLIGGGGG